MSCPAEPGCIRKNCNPIQRAYCLAWEHGNMVRAGQELKKMIEKRQKTACREPALGSSAFAGKKMKTEH